jgi:hypothetical protein
VLLLITAVAGCSLVEDGGMFGRKPKSEPPAAVAPLESQLALEHLDLLERLSTASPAGQAEIVELVRREVEVQPGISNQLRYALVLALPGHAGSDPVAARTALGTLLATPERLLPAEQALARVMLQDVNARLALLSENQNLFAEARQEGEERAQALNRRLQAQSAENARLKQELQDALAKLEAVADLERSMAERQAAPKVRQP